MANSLATVTYTMDDVNYSREYFTSYPDRVMAINLKSDVEGKIGFSIRHAFTQESNEVIVKGDEIHIKER